MAKPYELTEHQIQAQILDWLRLKRRFFWRNNTGASKASYNSKVRFYRFGSPGSPDIFVIREGVIYGVEVKAYKGQQSQTQVYWQTEFEKAGGKYILARSLADVEAVL